MKRTGAWMLVAGAMLGFAIGCADQNKNNEPVAVAPAQEPLPSFPETQVPPPEPQPMEAAPRVTAPPVDTSVRVDPAPEAKAKSKPQPKENYAAPKKAQRVHVVRKGETLQKISMKYYKTNKNWQRIYQANRGVLKDDPNTISPGMKLVIPE